MTVTNRMAAFAVLVALMSNVASAGDSAINGLPNTTLTPGAVDLAITPQNIKSTGCISGMYAETPENSVAKRLEWGFQPSSLSDTDSRTRFARFGAYLEASCWPCRKTTV